MKSKKSKTVEIRGVGEVMLERSRRAKNINLTIRPCKNIRVAVPIGVSFTDAELFARSKSRWIKKHLARIEVVAEEVDRINAEPIDRKAAREIIVKRLNELSGRHDLPYNKVFVKNQKTRWGSCSMKNNINLNMNLVRLPRVLMDYAIMHELVHTLIKDHSTHYWDTLEQYLPDARQLDRKLNRYWMILV
ncbi:MAG: M48 family metallopeptidase [Thermodesulfobacteriota bacterium]